MILCELEGSWLVGGAVGSLLALHFEALCVDCEVLALAPVGLFIKF